MDERASSLLLRWYDATRRELPWRTTHDPYPIWLSEIMLQQTRVETVKGYYERFLTLFPTVRALAEAPEEAVLKAWEGLGYYSRARNLQKAARVITEEYGGRFPESFERLLKLPGIGPYTAGAIASIAFGQRVPAIDGNVTRVASRFFGVREDVAFPAVQREIHGLVKTSLPQTRVGDYNQALMELGATLCAPAAPACDLCPWQVLCDACAEGDAELLPRHEKKRPPKSVDMAVCLLSFENWVLVSRRAQRMLNGLYVFLLLEEETDPRRAQERLAEMGLPCAFSKALGTARHVFTHRVWEMNLWHYQLAKMPENAMLEALGARMADADELAALPFPTAMRAAKEKALALIGEA